MTSACRPGCPRSQRASSRSAAASPGLRRHLFRLRFSWSDGLYSADVRDLNEDGTSGKTLQAAIGSAKAMIVGSLDAPAQLAPDLRVRVDLEENAARQFAEHGQ